MPIWSSLCGSLISARSHCIPASMRSISNLSFVYHTDLQYYQISVLACYFQDFYRPHTDVSMNFNQSSLMQDQRWLEGMIVISDRFLLLDAHLPPTPIRVPAMWEEHASNGN